MDTPQTDLADPAFYDFYCTENIRFSDTDLVGHVNNVAHVALVESGRIAYVYDLATRAGVQTGQVTFARLEIDFRADLFYPGQVRIGARVLAVGTTSFTVGIGVFSDQTCVTTSRNVLVHLGGEGRPEPLPEAFRRTLLAQI
ncbi:MAG: acyl-CoA thioesterase [Euzebya sp.]